jgi:xanthine dehydrogenase accessory factor
MSELVPVLEALLDDVKAGRPCALCTVVNTRGSTPQAPGAAMLLREDCSSLGTLGGGCVEEEVKRRAHATLTTGQSALFDFVLDHDYGWDDGLICGGRMDIAVIPSPDDPTIAAIRSALADAIAGRPASVEFKVRHDAEELAYRLHLEVPPTLIIAGAGHVAKAVARLAVDLDFAVTVIDDRADYASPERFPAPIRVIVDDIAAALVDHPIDASSYVVVVTRGHSRDHQALDAVVRRDAGYVGMIGSRRKSRMILSDLAGTGTSQELIDRVHTPIGVDIGAVTVPEIAVSIVAQLVQHRRQRTAKRVEAL